VCDDTLVCTHHPSPDTAVETRAVWGDTLFACADAPPCVGLSACVRAALRLSHQQVSGQVLDNEIIKAHDLPVHPAPEVRARLKSVCLPTWTPLAGLSSQYTSMASYSHGSHLATRRLRVCMRRSRVCTAVHDASSYLPLHRQLRLKRASRRSTACCRRRAWTSAGCSAWCVEVGWMCMCLCVCVCVCVCVWNPPPPCGRRWLWRKEPAA
jgi:hypothetical protein